MYILSYAMSVVYSVCLQRMNLYGKIIFLSSKTYVGNHFGHLSELCRQMQLAKTGRDTKFSLSSVWTNRMYWWMCWRSMIQFAIYIWKSTKTICDIHIKNSKTICDRQWYWPVKSLMICPLPDLLCEQSCIHAGGIKSESTLNMEKRYRLGGQSKNS